MDTREDAVNKVIDMARMVVEYRSRVTALSFQLEKADYWFDMLSQAIECLDEVEAQEKGGE